MKIYNIIIIFLLSFSNLLAVNKIDSLKQIITELNGKEKIETSIQLAKLLVDRTKLDDAFYYAQNALELSKKKDDFENIVISYAIIGKGYLLAGDLSNAKQYADSANYLAKKQNYLYGSALSMQIIGAAKVYSGEIKAGLQILDSTLVLFNKKEYLRDKGVSILLIASIFAATGQVDSSIVNMERAEEIFNEIDEKYKIAVVKLNKGMLQSSFLGQYENSIDNSLEALTYFEEVEDTLKIGVALSNIATCYDAIGNYDRSIEYFNKLLSMVNDNNPIFSANFYNNFGEVYKHKGDYISALIWYEKSRDIGEKLGIDEVTTVANNNIGECYYYKNEYDKALKFFNKSIAKVDLENDHYKMSILYKNIANVYLAKNQNDTAIKYYKLSIASGHKLSLLEELFPAYEQLSLAYKNKRNYKDAYETLSKYAEIKNEFLENSNADRLTDKEIKYQTEKKQQEIELLTKNEKIQSLELSDQKSTIFTMIVIVVFVVLLSIVLFKRNRDKNKLNAILSEKNKMIEKQSEELKTTNEELRASEINLQKINTTKDKFFSIIAHDLKGPFSSLIGLSELLAKDINKLSHEEIQEMGIGLNNAANKVFSLAENLLEWSRTQLGIINVEKLSFDFNELVEENIRLYHESIQNKKIVIKNELCSNSMINADKEMINFTLRNLLSNALKFTKSEGEIKIRSSVEENSFVIAVSDNGVGIKEEHIDKLFDIESTFTTEGTGAEKGTGLGLILAREFVEKNGGSLTVSSKFNLGSTFKIKIPKN